MKLSPQQLAAVNTDSKRAFVIAGAGAGKTSTLTARITKLIQEDGISPYDVLAFTFTRKAAEEMRGRLIKSLGDEAKKVHLATMHSVGLRLIQQFGERIGLRENLTVYSEWESEMLLRDVCQELGVLIDGRWKIRKKDILAVFNQFEQTGEEPDAYHEVFPVFQSFHQRCKENNALPYSGLIHGLRLLLEDGCITEHANWRHILVDEVQDIDLLQWSIIEQLVTKLKASLFCVGDVNQSIYGFRGAAPAYLLEHKDSFDIFPIEKNYRSATSIVNAANRLITHNKERFDTIMTPTVIDNHEVIVGKLPNATGAMLAGCMQHVISTGADVPENITVLARSHGLLEGLGKALSDLNIPFRRVGEKNALTRSEAFRTVIAPIKLAVNPYDNFSYMLYRRVLGVFDECYQEIRTTAILDVCSHYQAHCAKFESFTDGKSFIELVYWSLNKVATATDLPQMDRISFILGEWCGAHPDATAETFLEWLTFYDVQDELDEETEPSVTLMTVHASKGLEFPTVFLYGCNETILPHKKSMTAKGIEEERRLTYVAVTRAEERLILAVRPEIEERLAGDEIVTLNTPESRFIAELELT